MSKHNKIFIVDDDPNALLYMEELLYAYDYVTETFINAELVIDRLKHEVPDLILLDLNLGRDNGFDILKYLKKTDEYKEIPVIMLTAESTIPNRIRGYDMGAIDYISKPIHKEEFLARLNRHIELARYHKLFAKRTAEKLLENENILINKNKELEHKNIQLIKYATELEKLTVVLQDSDAQLNMMNYELKIAKKQAEEGEALKAAFLANMSHEIRTPLNAIIGFASFLNEQKLKNENRLRYAHIIRQSGSHLLELINNIVDLAKIDAGQAELVTETCDLNALMSELFDLFDSSRIGEEHGAVKINVHHPRKKVFANLDETRIRQVIINLLGNALKFTIEGRIDFGYELKEHQLCFFVQDTGIGIGDEKLPFVFDRFRQVHDKKEHRKGGTGLGLSISKECVEMHGGTMEVKSVLGKGTTFSFSIPYIQAEMPVVDEVYVDSQGVVFENKKLLVIDNDDATVEFIEVLLSPYNIEVVSACDGKEAFEYLKTDVPDIVLAEIDLPGENGIEVMKKIKSQFPECIVVIQTAYAFNRDREQSYEAGCDAYIMKPTPTDKLLKLLDYLLQQK